MALPINSCSNRQPHINDHEAFEARRGTKEQCYLFGFYVTIYQPIGMVMRQFLGLDESKFFIIDYLFKPFKSIYEILVNTGTGDDSRRIGPFKRTSFIATMKLEGTLDALMSMIFVHPALPEVARDAVRDAAAQLFGLAADRRP